MCIISAKKQSLINNKNNVCNAYESPKYQLVDKKQPKKKTKA